MIFYSGTSTYSFTISLRNSAGPKGFDLPGAFEYDKYVGVLVAAVKLASGLHIVNRSAVDHVTILTGNKR